MTDSVKIGVIGLGVMGLGITQVFAQAGFDVVASDAVEAARATALRRLSEILEPRVAAGKLATAERDAILTRVAVVDEPAGFSACSLIVEAIAERLDAKQELFRALESSVADRCVLATNTSSLSVGAIADGLKHPERVLGLHFFNPAPAMRLVELVAHAGSNAASLETARHAAAAAGKTVVTCADRPGFIVNRCARPFYGEALALLEEGRTVSDIDAAMLAAGYRIGPLSLIDLIGADINLAASQGLSVAMGGHPRYHVFEALKTQVIHGNLGRKSGRGFLYPDVPGAAPADADSIALRVQAALVNEAASLLSEGGVTADGIDTAMKLALNFPRGPFETGKLYGRQKILAELARLEAAAPPYLKGRYIALPALGQVI